jgi:platelet-activating factor acetylhydrolase
MGLLWRRFILYGSASFLFGFFIFSLTPITSPLPRYTGAHAVGVLDVETGVEKRVIKQGILKETGEEAFELETLAITLYYPSTLASPSPSQPQPLARPWLPQPISLIGTGYARLAHVYFPPFQWMFTFTMWLLGSNTVIPGVVDAPLLSTTTDDQSFINEEIGRPGSSSVVSGKDSHVVEEVLELRGQELGTGSLPLVVFTHGMAGMSQSYSHYLGSIASYGYVVAAVEHRDGSGPGTIVHNENEKEKRRIWHLQLQDIE